LLLKTLQKLHEKAQQVYHTIFRTPDEKLELGSHLHEISGMAWVPSQEMILAENDEKGMCLPWTLKTEMIMYAR
jgi:hypothetical protein